jgi:hypothetical protein
MTIGASRVQLIWSPVVGWVLLSCAATVAQAQVDTPTPARQTLEQQTPTVDLPEVLSSPTGGGPLKESNELGISVGAFTLFPRLELDLGYDSNVFAQTQTSGQTQTTGQTQTQGPVASAVALVRPSLALQSEWLNHSLRILASGGFGYYASAPTQNYQNYKIQADFKIDIGYDFYLTGLIGFIRSTEALGTPNVTFAQAPTVVYSVPARLGLYQKFNRLFYELAVSATRYRYFDYSTITDLGLPGASRNRTDYEQSLRLGYEIIDGVSVWVAPAFQQSVYAETVNSAGQQRDSRSWLVNVGTTIKTSAKTNVEASLGVVNQTYLADGMSTSAFLFALAGTWHAFEPLTLRPLISRSINQSALSNYQNYVSTTYGVDFVYDVHGPWKAVGGVAYNTADYMPAPGVAGVNPRTDYFFKGSIGVLYNLRPQYSIGPVYEFTQGSTTDIAAGGPSYTRSLFSVRLMGTW